MKQSSRAAYLVGFFAFLATCYFCVGVGQTANNVSAYKVTPITPPASWTNVVPADINNAGQIVGYGVNGTTTQPFIADTRSFTPIALPQFFVSGFGLGINSSGQIVGWGGYAPPLGAPVTQIFVGGIGGITDIRLGTITIHAVDINDSGQIVGEDLAQRPMNCDLFEAFTRTPSGALRKFFDPLAPEFVAEFGLSINNLGQIAGLGHNSIFQDPRFNRCFQVLVGDPLIFLGGANGTITPIATPAGWIPFTPGCCPDEGLKQINDSEQIVATVRPTNGANITRVALSTRSSTLLIPAPPGVVSVTRPNLNNLGQVVGQIVGAIGGWIWDSSNGTRLLQDLVPSNWTILSADGINDQGQVLARASNNLGFSGPVILDPEVVNVPDRPANLNSVCNSDTRVTLSWSSVANANSYYLRINDLSKANPNPYDYVVDNLSGTTFTADVKSGHEYVWWVHAANVAGAGAANRASFTCPSAPRDTTAPTISSLIVSDITPSSASISWTTNEPAYGQVEFSAPCPSTGCLTPFGSTMVTSHRVDVANLAASTTYTFRVRAKDASGNAATSLSQTFTTGAPSVGTPTTVPGAPSNLEALCKSATQVTLRWSPVSTAASYYLRVNELSKGGQLPYDYAVDALNATTFTANITSGRVYAWWVHAANLVGLSASAKGTFSCPAP